MKTFLFSLMFVPLFLKMCAGSEEADDRVRLAKVGSEIIYLDEVVEGMPSGLSAKDSTAYVSQYIQNRTKEILMYEQAQSDVKNVEEVDELVENYRRSLIIHSFQQEMLNAKMQHAITDTALQIFYQNNRDRFLTGHDLVKGVLIKVPKTAPGMERLKRIYRKKDDEAFQQIETFCVQNNGNVEYFYDHWVLFIDLLANVSYEISNPTEFLRTHSYLDVVVGDYQYLLNVDDYVTAGSTAPYEYVKDEVRSVVTNTKKTDFLHRYEQELYQIAKKKGRITYYEVNLKKSNQ
jgi:hypothetical protein